VRGVLCGDDGALADAERIAHCISPDLSNGIHGARRDKFLMNEALRAAGVPACRQLAPHSWEEARDFLRSSKASGGLPAVIKPRRGSSSINVGLARSEEEAELQYRTLAAMDEVFSSMSVPEGSDGPDPADLAGWGAPVIQECLGGDEWIVDTVSREGQHKVAALFRYDKGSVNGAAFVYYGIETMSMKHADAEALRNYALATLDALGWRWGPCHLEIKITPHGPRLVEANMGRWNGIKGAQHLARACYGHGIDTPATASAIGGGGEAASEAVDTCADTPDEAFASPHAYADAYDLAISCFLDDEKTWATRPDTPPTSLRAHGRVVHLVSHVEGSLLRIGHQADVDQLRSLAAFAPKWTHTGEVVQRTTCFNSCAGEALLIHHDPGVVRHDYRILRQLQPTLFRVSPTPLPLYLRVGDVVRQVYWDGDGQPCDARQLVVDGVEIRGSNTREEVEDTYVAGVSHMRLKSDEGEVSVVEVANLRAPEYEPLSL
jgi:hypothetical protein